MNRQAIQEEPAIESPAIFKHEFVVPDSALDQNGHVNNVVYVQWMQDVAILHSNAVGGTRAMGEAGAMWVVRSDAIEYRRPAFAGESVTALTWVVDFRRVQSLRRYRFVRNSDNIVLAIGETEWVSVDAATGRPCKVPEPVRLAFPIGPRNLKKETE